MTGVEWIAEKINSESFQGANASVESETVVFVERIDKPDAYVGIVPTNTSDPIVSLDEVRRLSIEKSEIAMIIAIPHRARWSGTAMRWLQSEGIAFGGVGDLLSAINGDGKMSTHRNKLLAFVDDGLRRHSRVEDCEWIDSKKVKVLLRNGVAVTIALEDAYDITMNIARDAASRLGNFDVLLKTNPNGSVTSSGAENVDRLGFQTLNWRDLFGYLAKRGR